MILVDALTEVRSMDPELSNVQKIDAFGMRSSPLRGLFWCIFMLAPLTLAIGRAFA